MTATPAVGPVTGGCQCGAVRYRAASLGGAAICHCRMCQKAVGHFHAALVTAHGVSWTRGAPAAFASSNVAERGFCRDCGTPLYYLPARYGRGEYELTIGSLDDPSVAPPTMQVNGEGRFAFVDSFGALPHATDIPTADVAIKSFQAPDHD